MTKTERGGARGAEKQRRIPLAALGALSSIPTRLVRVIVSLRFRRPLVLSSRLFVRVTIGPSIGFAFAIVPVRECDASWAQRRGPPRVTLSYRVGGFGLLDRITKSLIGNTRDD